ADDAGVRELCEHLDLACGALGEVALLVGDDLDGHGLAGDRIAGAEHRAHAAAADLLLELEPVVEQLPEDHGCPSSASSWPGRACAGRVQPRSITPSSCTEGPRSQVSNPDLRRWAGHSGADAAEHPDEPSSVGSFANVAVTVALETVATS